MEVEGTTLPGEGVHGCTFRNGQYGILLNYYDYFSPPSAPYGGDFSTASVDHNTFDNLMTGFYGSMGNGHLTTTPSRAPSWL